MTMLVVVPTYNEADNLPALAKDIISLPFHPHLLVVDDSSPDGTGQIADELARANPDVVHVIHRSTKSGLGRAYIEGFLWALQRKYARVAQMDADRSHDPAALRSMVEAADAGAGLVIGSRYLNGISVINWPLRRILLSLAANEYVRRVTGMPIHDATSGFRIYLAEALLAIDLKSISSNGYSFQVEMTYRAHLCGFKTTEVPIVFTERRAGMSKMSKGVILESAMMPWKLRLRRRALERILKAK